MEILFREQRHTIRQLRKAPGFTLAAVLTLAFGIGATTTIFSIVEGVLLRPLPFADPSRLVTLDDRLSGAGDGVAGISAPEIAPYTHDTHSFTSVAAYRREADALTGVGEPAQISVTRLSASGFPTLGVSPLFGRVYTLEEDVQRQQVAILSYQTWRTRFHGDTNILGRKIQLDRREYQVIGVMPATFEFPLLPGQIMRSELWVPLSLTDAEQLPPAISWNYSLFGRLKPGVSASQAQFDAQQVAQQVMRGFPAAMSTLHISSVVQPLDEATVAQARPLVRTLFLAVAFVLFIACTNLAGLLLVRVIRRRREIAVRIALGATAASVLRQTLLETLTLSAGGAALGLAAASVTLRAGVRFLPENLPRIASITLDWQVSTFAFVLAILTGLLCGVVPALAASRTTVNDALKEGGRTGTSGGSQSRLRSGLVIAELAVALVLLTASGLFLRSFEKLRSVDLGFRPSHSLTASYSLPDEHYRTQAQIDAFNDQLLLRLQQLPGIEHVGVTSQLPISGGPAGNSFLPEGTPPAKDGGLILGWTAQAFGDYFAAAGIPILRGRDFTEADRPDAPLVAIVNRTLAQRFWPNQDPIGKRLHFGLRDTPLPWLTVIGEIGDVKQTNATAPVEPQIFQPAAQAKASYGMLAPAAMLNADTGSIMMRGSIPPEQMENALRSIVHSLDPQLPLIQVESMQQVVEEGQSPQRFNVSVISFFAIAAALLAVLGIYSVIAFSAALRTQEMAIRLALGAQRQGIMKIILLSGARLGLIGCTIGAVLAIFATRLVRTLLFEVDPLDPTVIALAAIAIFLIAIAASAIPARRAASIEPIEALRSE
ncbi:putative permease [Granulicella aggregans]|uniref:Putative permease n=1 Tax=Granulicella aggregans TaxID=474949 RepID=A0A7W7ZDX4_9BACT|nr:ABC transporter permease [Granulicella aggregans]MBB5058110.1 putative permease [Granulicella aggregans]